MNLSRAAHFVCASVLVLTAACNRYEEFEAVKDSARSRTQSPAKPVPAPTPTTQSSKWPPVGASEKPSGPITAQALPAPGATSKLPQLKLVAGGSTIVAKGETLFAVSRRTGVDVTDLISANELQPPYGVQAGQLLKIPSLRYHRVEQGETASSIARRHDVTLLDIVRINNLSEPYGVVIGQQVKLPSDETEMIALAPPLKIPPPKPAVVPAPSKPPLVVATIPSPGTPSPVVIPAPLPPPTPIAPAPAAVLAEAPRFVWPVRGRVVAAFGDLGNGRYNDGVNLAVTRGEAVKVAADGVVLFAQTMRGFGNLILVRHAGNWLTAYGHNDVLLVARGTTVKRGETIARAGQSGTVSSPQLHFEVRRGSKPLNPLQYLPDRGGV
jgi:murein DD-endopeptidase MepM/ murein hydrolase activator NlpD